MEELKGLQVSKSADLNLLARVRGGQRKVGFLAKILGRRPPQLTFSNVEILHVNQRLVIVVVDAFLELYEMELGDDLNVKVTLTHQVDCGRPVQLSCTNWNTNASGALKTFVAVATENSLQLYDLDLKNKVLNKKSDTSVKPLRTMSFLGETKLAVMSMANFLIKYECTTGILVRKSTTEIKLHIPKVVELDIKPKEKVKKGQPAPPIPTSTEFITQSFIYGQLTEETEGTLYYLYFTTTKLVDTFIERFYIKEITQRNDTIEEGQLFTVVEIENSDQLFSKAKIVKCKDLFGIVIDSEVVIVRKRNEGYYFFDTILRKRDSCTLWLTDDSLLCSIENKSIEISKMTMSELKCQLKIIDVIYYDIPPEYVFKSIKPVTLDKVQTFALFFSKKDDPSCIRVLNMVKVEALKKLMDLVSKKGPDKLQLPIIQELGQHLGISKKDFYLKLWYSSQRQLADVNDKLLMTEDVQSIKREMKVFLRRKRVPLFELLKVYTKLHDMIREKLRLKLDIKLLKNYIKVNFLMRKIKIQPDMINSVGFVEYMDIKSKSMVDVLHKCIQDDMKLAILCTKDREKYGKQIQKNEAIMRDVLSEFRIVLLEDYDTFLYQVISPFSNRLDVIFDRYSFMLPRHPYEAEFRPAITTKLDPDPIAMNKSIAQLGGTPQPKIFNPVKEIEWNLEMSKEKIIQELSECNLTSSVVNTLDVIVKSSFFSQKKLIRHALIASTRSEYIDHINRNSGSRLFLKACEFANLLNLDNPSFSPKLIVDKFQKNNNLTGEELARCTFYSELHLFMRRYGVGNNMEMEKLLSLSEEDLVALFFLGNQQKHNLILRELRNLYDNSTSSENELSIFDSVIQKFVMSENCSPVEIKLLTEAIKQMGPDFQQLNQPLVQIIIEGFCQRLQVRQDDKIDQFIQIFQPVHLNQALNEKMMRIIKIRELAVVFQHFKCQKENVHLVEKQGKIMLSRVLENYFTGDILGPNIIIDEQEINLDTPRNMLNIMLYLQEKLYPEVTEWEVLVIFGQRMIDYEVFDVLNEIIHQDNVLELLNIDSVQYTQCLIRNTLEKIYNEESITSFESVKDHMYNILRLQKQETPYLTICQARLRLCELITECNFEITPYKVYNIKSRSSFMFEFVERGFEGINLEQLFEVYRCFQIIAEEEPDEEDTELLTYLAYFAKALKSNGKVSQAIKVLQYLIDHDVLEELYPLVTETIILAMKEKYPQDFDTARIYLQAYALNFSDKFTVLEMFKSNFEPDRAHEFEMDIDEITINEDMTFLSWRKVTVDVKTLENIARELKNDNEFYRYFFFLLTMLTRPAKGFCLTEINYDLFVLQAALDKVGAAINAIQDRKEAVFSNLNEYQMRKLFIKGLWDEAKNRTNQDEKHELNLERQLDEDFTYLNVVSALKEKKETDLVRMLYKSQKYLIDNRNAYLFKFRKAEKYQAELEKDINDVKEEEPKVAVEEPVSKSFIEQRLNKTMTLAEFMEEACNLTQNFPNLNDKQISARVWDDASKRNRPASPTIHKKHSDIGVRNIISEVEHEIVSQHPLSNEEPTSNRQPGRKEQIFKLFDDSKYYEIQSLDREQLLQCMKQYYYSDRNIADIIKLMRAVKIGEDRNLKIVQSALRVPTPLDLKELFSFDYYFYVPQQPSPTTNEENKEELTFYGQIFNYLTPVLRRIVTQDNPMELSKIIYISFKYEKWFEFKIFLFALEKLICSRDEIAATSFNILMDEYLSKMAMSTKFILKHYKEILDACLVNKEYLPLVRDKLLSTLKRKDPTHQGVDHMALAAAIEDIESRL